MISHFKGHVCCGFRGAIKNLGMGALSKKSKSKIHDGGKPEIKKECLKCGACIKACPINGIELKDKPEFKNCYGCSNCIYTCPHKVLEPKTKEFDFLLADGANSAQSQFKKFYYINFLINISKECDCEDKTPDKIAEDIGYIFGKDPVAIDKASRDLVIKKEGENVFLKNNKKSGIEQINEAEKIGMGNKEYNLININPNS